ncbi:prolyl oligopeptidase family serine peptidase [Sabulibacter ruber]|uniref:prolyl oligopeptidase family serine peptidase n=1 Tax=Sabulibacter ruber TaxID=2811901 RepID=UPI001A95824A|nr:prolyl oligopeptidase family serine peptidase [Sabulibacter ruber]
MKHLYALVVTFLWLGNAFAQEFEYPVSRKVEIADTYHEKYKVKDEYRWLEELNGPDVNVWLESQRKLSNKFLTKVEFKYNTLEMLNKFGYTRFDYPQKAGKYYFQYGTYNSLAVPALFYQSSLIDNPRVLVDPNYISKKENISIEGYALSKDSELLAYQFSRNGSDWAEVHVVSMKDAVQLKDHLVNVKFSNLAWKDNGFFYSTFKREDALGKTLGQKVYYHKVGTSQSEDKLIFERQNPAIEFDFLTTSDERFFILKEKNEQAGKRNIFYIDYQAAQPTLKPLLTNLTYTVNILDARNGKFIAATGVDSNTGSVVEIDPANPLKWNTISPGFSKAVLLDATPLQDKLITVYQSNQRPIISVFSYEGKPLYNLEMPVGTSVGGFRGAAQDQELLFHYGSYTLPPVVYNFNVANFERKVFRQTTINFLTEGIEYKEVEFSGKDGTKIPMILVYEKGLKLDGKNPVILEAYGGFGVIEQPSFDPGVVYFIKKGGVYAFANIRGGGDLGADWARQGRGARKQNSFDDFISAAEYLIKSGYTSPSKLAITGASNGGLVVAAAAIQRPDLFKAVVPVVAPLDMIRFEKFTVGHWHTDEYGTVANNDGFLRLQGYSPYHNIKEEVNYPAMLIMTSENDERVPPFHSYKFAARLQSRKAQKNPILLRVTANAGHQGGVTRSSRFNEKAEKFGFIMQMLDSQ